MLLGQIDSGVCAFCCLSLSFSYGDICAHLSSLSWSFGLGNGWLRLMCLKLNVYHTPFLAIMCVCVYKYVCIDMNDEISWVSFPQIGYVSNRIHHRSWAWRPHEGTDVISRIEWILPVTGLEQLCRTGCLKQSRSMVLCVYPLHLHYFLSWVKAEWRLQQDVYI